NLDGGERRRPVLRDDKPVGRDCSARLRVSRQRSLADLLCCGLGLGSRRRYLDGERSHYDGDVSRGGNCAGSHRTARHTRRRMGSIYRLCLLFSDHGGLCFDGCSRPVVRQGACQPEYLIQVLLIASTRTSLEISTEEPEEGVFAAGGLAGFGAGGTSGAGSAGSPKTLELRTAGGECQTVRRVVQPVSINQSHGQLRGNRSSRRRPVRMIRPATASNRKR